MKFDLHVEDCPICGKAMMRKCKSEVFPMAYNKDQDAQMKSKGVVYTSDAQQNREYICVECANADKSRFKCYICGKTKHSSKIEKSFGDPPEYLCKDCYASIPAKKWDETVDYLESAHRWDFN